MIERDQQGQGNAFEIEGVMMLTCRQGSITLTHIA